MFRLMTMIGCAAALYLLSPALGAMFMALQNSFLFSALTYMFLFGCITFPLLLTVPMLGLGLLLTSLLAPHAVVGVFAAGATFGVGAILTVSMGVVIGGALAIVGYAAETLLSAIRHVFTSEQEDGHQFEVQQEQVRFNFHAPQLPQSVRPSAPPFDQEPRGMRFFDMREQDARHVRPFFPEDHGVGFRL